MRKIDRHTIQKDRVLRRRDMVARLRLRGLTLREIADKLWEYADSLTGEHPFRTSTGGKLCLRAISRDLECARQLWIERAAQSVEVHVSRLIAELSEVKRQAWLERKWPVVLRAIEQEAALLSARGPVRVLSSEDIVDMVANDE